MALSTRLDRDALFRVLEQQLDVISRQQALARAAADGISDAYQLGQLVRRIVGRWVNENYRRRPMIIPVVMKV